MSKDMVNDLLGNMSDQKVESLKRLSKNYNYLLLAKQNVKPFRRLNKTKT